MAGKVAKAAQGGLKAWLMPEINDIKVQLAEIRGDIKSLTTRVHEMDKRLTADIQGLDRRLTAEIQGIKENLNVVQRLAVLEAKQRESEKRSSG